MVLAPASCGFFDSHTELLGPGWFVVGEFHGCRFPEHPSQTKLAVDGPAIYRSHCKGICQYALLATQNGWGWTILDIRRFPEDVLPKLGMPHC